MAEFCLDCMNRLLMEADCQLTEKDVTMEVDLCEGCGKWKPCVITIKKELHVHRTLSEKIKRAFFHMLNFCTFQNRKK